MGVVGASGQQKARGLSWAKWLPGHPGLTTFLPSTLTARQGCPGGGRMATVREGAMVERENQPTRSSVLWPAWKRGEVVGWESSREVLGKKLETYASIQSFMLHRYSKRIAKFRKASLESQRRICEVYSLSECERESWAEVLIERHMHILVKMKRRLKHMMDVSDKYFLTDLLDTLHLLGQATSELAPPMEGEGYNMDSLSSSSSFDTLSTSPSYLSLSSPTIPSISCTSSSSSSSSTAPSRHLKLRPFRSLLDQLVVLGKTYTERGD